MEVIAIGKLKLFIEVVVGLELISLLINLCAPDNSGGAAW